MLVDKYRIHMNIFSHSELNVLMMLVEVLHMEIIVNNQPDFSQQQLLFHHNKNKIDINLVDKLKITNLKKKTITTVKKKVKRIKLHTILQLEVESKLGLI